MILRTAALTDIGRIRRHNEDRLIHEEKLSLFGVADGVGGLPGGAEAAQTATEFVVGHFRQIPNPKDLVGLALEVNRAVSQLGLRLSPRQGIGTTLTFGHFLEARLRLIHVGDSRCYAWRGGALSCLTRDHSLENELKARGQLFELANLSEHSRNALTRCIGQYTPLQVDFSEHDLCPGDRFLFCSDGITKMIREPEIAQALSASTDPAATAALLIQKANHRGGLDNATAVVIQVDSNS